MCWNETEKKVTAEKVINISVIHGEFQTYSIKGIPSGSAYLANGFITKSY